jgi:hypothetical protein
MPISSHRPTTSGNIPSAHHPTTQQQCCGSNVAPLPPRMQQPTSVGLHLSTSGCTVTAKKWPTCQAHSMSWPTICPAAGTYLTHNCLLILIRHIRRRIHGNCHLQEKMNSATTLALSRTHCDAASLAAATLLPPHTGTFGYASVKNTHWDPTFPKDAGSKFLLNKYAMAGFLPLVTLSELERWQKPSLLLQHRTQWLASPTHV